MSSAAPVTTSSIASAFIRKLYRLLDIEDSQVIGWDAQGLSFSIRDEEEFDMSVLPRYFRGRVDVFRQHLAEHGFKSTVTAGSVKEIETFVHEHFVRGQASRLSKIVRIPSTKRRRSKLGKKRSTPSAPQSAQANLTNGSEVSPSFVDDDNFDLCAFLQEPSTLQPCCVSNQSSNPETLHDSLVRILALHATAPVAASRNMLNADVGRLGATSVIETPIFTDDMMTSMFEWLDTRA